jgi:hypothetical protein
LPSLIAIVTRQIVDLFSAVLRISPASGHLFSEPKRAMVTSAKAGTSAKRV